jgi:hypothetical protein
MRVCDPTFFLVIVVDRDNILCYLPFSTNNGREGQV